MTRRQRKCLLFIQDHIARYGRAPRYTEIATALGLTSQSGAFESVHKLIAEGYLTINPHHALSSSLRVVRPITPIIDVFVFNDETKRFEPFVPRHNRRGVS